MGQTEARTQVNSSFSQIVAMVTMGYCGKRRNTLLTSQTVKLLSYCWSPSGRASAEVLAPSHGAMLVVVVPTPTFCSAKSTRPGGGCSSPTSGRGLPLQYCCHKQLPPTTTTSSGAWCLILTLHALGCMPPPAAEHLKDEVHRPLLPR